VSENLLVVDKDNNVVAPKDRKIVHATGLYHRAVGIVIIGSRNRILLQRRSAGKDVCPLFWDLSAAEHVKPGESYEETAKRGVEEELGLKNAKLVKIRGVHLQKNEYLRGKLKDYEFVELYRAVCDGKIDANKAEVCGVRFLPFSKIEELARKGVLTPWFLDELEWLKNNGPELVRVG
jgi:isopentenyldiphosphate isomerase